MKPLILAMLCGLTVASEAQVPDSSLRTDQPTALAPKRPLPPPEPVNRMRSTINTNLFYSGAIVEAIKTSPLQLFNPIAPPAYGYAETNLVRDPIRGNIEGVKLFAISF